MKELRKNIYFFHWYTTYYVEMLKSMLQHLPSSDHAMVIKKITNTWKLANKSDKIESIHPPLDQIKLGKEEIMATLFKSIKPNNDMVK